MKIWHWKKTLKQKLASDYCYETVIFSTLIKQWLNARHKHYLILYKHWATLGVINKSMVEALITEHSSPSSTIPFTNQMVNFKKMISRIEELQNFPVLDLFDGH
ncbi:hypothetical protein CEXT_256131 [Caerostris extrusa]|uniref:Uncharacterized protein n=1 Tax=Caerostris extrusa TaxID=172846 RepID=A0AAV4SPJ8_CAEEX|nr:hypothetical protein CEXT_256131 [Caerostris extrusa]